MADLLVAAAIGGLTSATMNQRVQYSFSFSKDEESLLEGVHDMMDDIKSDLMSIQSLLCHTEQRMLREKEAGDGLSIYKLLDGWVAKVRDVAYKLEVILDTHMCGISLSYVGKSWVYRTYKKTAKELKDTAPKVKEVVQTCNNIIRKQVSLYLSDGSKGSSSTSMQPRNVSSTPSRLAEDDVFFSLNEKGVSQKDIIETWILEQPARFANVVAAKWNVCWTCIALWGMGGLGKTTLLGQIYHNNGKLMKQFACRAWVTVSKTYKVVNLLKEIIKQLMSPKYVDTSNKSEDELIDMVLRRLKKKRYLIVFDDIWEVDFWNKIENLFRRVDDCQRSRILFTTRDERVALSVAMKERTMKLEFLREEEAWLLFCKKAFRQEIESECPPDLEEWARKIVGKCGGLPLAIVATAGMMSWKQRDTYQWENSYRMLSSDLHKDPKLSILMHSYYDLPVYLKKCFLHLSSYPEDFINDLEYISRLWVAEEFVEEKQGITLEEQAEKYLHELVQRSLIQQVEGRLCLTHYKVHDTFRTIALNESINQRFVALIDGEHRHDNKCRRLSVYKYVDDCFANVDMEKLSSLTFLCLYMPTNLFSFRKFKLLKVLNFEEFPISNLPEEIFDLVNLRYLNLRKTKLNYYKFPREIGRLQNLQYLNLRSTDVIELPPSIFQLQKLRHLLFGRGQFGRGFRAGADDIRKLKDIQTLFRVEANENLVQQLGQLEQLQFLGITAVKQSHEQLLCHSLKKTRHLKMLDMHIDDGNLIDLELMSVSPFHIIRLRFFGGLKCIPTWFRSLENLTSLVLMDSNLPSDVDPLDYLRCLPHLVYLFIKDSHAASKISFHPGCFPSLRFLYIGFFSKLTSIEVDGAALPALRKLHIENCVLLIEPLPQVQNLQKLQELTLEGMTTDVVNAFREICDQSMNVRLVVS